MRLDIDTEELKVLVSALNGPPTTDSDQKDAKQEAWLRHFNALDTVANIYDKEFDSKLTYIGCGAVVLSVPFFSSKGLSGDSVSLFLIGESLIAISVVSHLILFLAFKMVIRKRQKEVKKNHPSGSEINTWAQGYRFWVTLANWIILLSLISGITILMYLTLHVLLP